MAPPGESLTVGLSPIAADEHDPFAIQHEIHAVDASGALSLRRDLPDRFLVSVLPSDGARFLFMSGALAQTFPCERWPAGEVREFEVLPYRTALVSVDLAAIHPDLREFECTLRVRPAGSPASDRTDSRAMQAQALEDTTRRFEFRATPGEYELVLSGPVLSETTSRITLADVEEPQRIELLATAR